MDALQSFQYRAIMQIFDFLRYRLQWGKNYSDKTKFFTKTRFCFFYETSVLEAVSLTEKKSHFRSRMK